MSLDLSSMKESTRIAYRKKMLRSLYCYAVACLGYDDLDPDLHGKVCAFLEGTDTRKDLVLPRGYIKTWLATIGFSTWISLPRTAADEFPAGVSPSDYFYNLGSNIRILIASYVIDNARKMINLIRKTYERNSMMQIFFPEVIPDNFTKVKWSDSEACLNRSRDYTESTFEAGGIGGSTTSRHYDIILEDDLIYAKKDDLTGQELQPNQEDIDKAIGWHKLAMSLLVPGAHTRIHNIGTCWAKHDLKDYIKTNEPSYVRFELAATDDGTIDGNPTWEAMYPKDKLIQIRDAQGPYMFSTQYLNKPIALEDMLFKRHWLQFYSSPDELPVNIRKFTTVDLSLWGQTKRKSAHSRGVVLTCGWDDKNHVWILHYDVDRYDPSEIIDLLYKHYAIFNPEKQGIEAVYYQKSLMHFLRKEMEKRGWLPIRELVTDSAVSKELRIRALEPYASNLAIHCRRDHKDFIEEFCDYVPGAVGKKDILDALAYQIQLARPGQAQLVEVKKGRNDFKVEYKVDDVLASLWQRGKSVGPFKEYEIGRVEPLDEELELSKLLNPFE